MEARGLSKKQAWGPEVGERAVSSHHVLGGSSGTQEHWLFAHAFPGLVFGSLSGLPGS